MNDHSRSCIISEFDQAMRPFFCQDCLIDMLSGNDIEMNGIGTTKTAVFLIVPDENTLYNAHLLDINKYPNMTAEGQDIPYPETASKATAVFDFEKCCCLMANQNTEQIIMPSDEELQELINRKCQESIEEEEKIEPVFGTKLLDELCVSGVGRGWHGLVLPIIEEIKLYNERHPGKEITIDQIKEKFGTLCFYTSGSPAYIKGMISIAEKESGHICEFCGARGKTTEINGWYKTLCEHHIKAKRESNHDHRLAERLYRKAMEKVEKS